MSATRIDKRRREPMGAALLNHQTHAPSGAFAPMVWRLCAKSFCIFPPSCTREGRGDSEEYWWTSCQTRGFVPDVPASGVATIPRRQLYREAGARHLRSAKAERTGTARCAELDKNISESSGALGTGNGANAKEAVTAKFPWQDNVNAAVDEAWQTPPLWKHLIAGPFCMMGPRASRTNIINETLCEVTTPRREMCNPI